MIFFPWYIQTYSSQVLPPASRGPDAFLRSLSAHTHLYLGPPGPHPSGSPRVLLTPRQASGKTVRSSSSISPHAGAAGKGCSPGSRCYPPHWLRKDLGETLCSEELQAGHRESPSDPAFFFLMCKVGIQRILGPQSLCSQDL